MYRVAGELTAHNYRFDEAVALLRRGLDARAADSPQMLSDLGMHLLRTGDEPGARAGARSVVQAVSARQADATTCSSMLDTLDKFVTVRDGDLIFKFDKDEAARAPGVRDPAGAQGAEDVRGDATSSRRRARS